MCNFIGFQCSYVTMLSVKTELCQLTSCQNIFKRMKNTIYLLAAIIITSAVACVPARKLEELQVKYDQLDSDFSQLKTMKEYGDTS